MIRRETPLADGSRAWTLVSQVEHARLSGELASRCAGEIDSSAVRQEVLAAILHHDDGWVDWERAPRLDPKLGRPLSFTELEAAEAVAIWDKSIDAAAAIGPLAAAMVAGHFLRLLGHSDHLRRDAPCITWQQQTTERRDQWLAQWHALDPKTHTKAVAAVALQWLWTFDEISLWFCLSCPTLDEPSRKAPTPYLAGRGTELEMELRATSDSPGVATASPWRFDGASIELSAAGRIVPAEAYASSQDLLAAAEPCRLDWRFSREV